MNNKAKKAAIRIEDMANELEEISREYAWAEAPALLSDEPAHVTAYLQVARHALLNAFVRIDG